jgi:uncharacterized membrane protein YgdD (TMEM256/DUF423 family)
MARKSLPREIGYYLIATAFLVYGSFRVYGGVQAVAQLLGWADTDIGRSVVDALAPVFAGLSQRALVPLSMAAYLGWSAIMGIVLTAGSLLALFKNRVGYLLMATYFVLFGGMFINYLVFNAKVAHLAVGLVLFLIMLRLSGVSPFKAAPPPGARMMQA